MPRVSAVRTHSQQIQELYTLEDDVAYCTNFDGLMEALNIPYTHDEWRLFIDASSGIKFALLNRGKILPTIPLAYSVKRKETCDNFKLILEKIKYEEFDWPICADFKVIHLLLGMQLGFIKFGCILCEWDSRDRAKHYTDFEWPVRGNPILRQKNVVAPPLVERHRFILPALHIKLGLMKNFVRAMDREGEGFRHLKTVFNKISDEKIKAGTLLYQ